MVSNSNGNLEKLYGKIADEFLANWHTPVINPIY
jgi:hypothetical protein